MITIKQWMEINNYRITESNEYENHLLTLDSWDGNQDGYSSSITFNPKTEEVQSVDVCDYAHNKAYRLSTNPNKQDDKNAYDGVDFIDLDIDEDFIEKAIAIANYQEYDDRIIVSIELEHKDAFALMLMAHEQDITLNTLINNILREEMSKDGKPNDIETRN